MDYQTPLKIVNMTKELLLTVPDNDQLINWTLTRDDVADTAEILANIGHKTMAAFLMHTMNMYPGNESEIISEIKHMKILKLAQQEARYIIGLDYKLQNNENKMLKREIMTKFEHSIKEISLN